ncbi:MAG TPA: hypothetical protein DCP66_04365 [Collinsella sp.]|nr:hypothetical protein [Collinsella sp.]
MITRLKKLRLQKGMTQKELSQYVWFGTSCNSLVWAFENLKHRDNSVYGSVDERYACEQFAFALNYDGDPMELLELVEEDD